GLEWLETNGIGGFGSGTISGANSRRYHALLTAATLPPLGRFTTVNKCEETLLIEGTSFELSSNRYPGRIFPDGYRFLRSFGLDPFPVWEFNVNGHVLVKKIFMPYGENATVTRYILNTKTLSRSDKVFLEVRPLLSCVDYHHLQHEDPNFSGGFESRGDVVRMRPYANEPEIFFTHSPGVVRKTGYWYRNFEYAIEQERGFDCHEDLFQPFSLTFDMAKPASVVISTHETDHVNAAKLEAQEVKRRESIFMTPKPRNEFERQLILAADQFIVARGEGSTIIAGYPWFSDWGRDTMIALNGLTLAADRPDVARQILLEYSKHISQGMLPNRFPDQGADAEYNTVDATLWYFEAIRSYAEKTEDHQFVLDQLYPALVDIIAWHLRGTRYNIHVDTDGLVYAGEPGEQLTWMDAKVDGQVITPRTGKAVEIQALWYNALRIMEDLAGRSGDDMDVSKFRAMADLAKMSFNAVFWNEDGNCLFDVLENGTRDPAVRPNQILAVSLHYSMLDESMSRAVVEKVERELLTPYGLRTLSPHDPAYVSVYIGSPFKRDSSYHQGTVWPWLIGQFVDAYRRVFPENVERVIQIIGEFEKALCVAGVGQISEIFDGDPPHKPRGCPAQAWSVGEILRVLRNLP
ncbi:MAG: amylo-alpha-1,6-glucosidase, partial [Acidobacteriota bacterium]